MDVDATLLGSTAPIAPGSSGNFTNSSHRVSFLFIPAIVRSLIVCFLACSNYPPWKQLITHALSPDERASLIAKVFSDPGEVEMLMQLTEDDVQAFINKIAGVISPNLTQRTSQLALIQTILYQLGTE